MSEIRVRLARVPCTATEQRLLRELLAYVGERKEAAHESLGGLRGGRRAHLVTLKDGEQLVLLMEDQAFCYWTATRDPRECLRVRLQHWLTGSAPFWRP